MSGRPVYGNALVHKLPAPGRLMNQYTIFMCRDAMGCHSTFIEKYRTRVLLECRKVKARDGSKTKQCKMLLPGMLFVHQYDAPDFRRHSSRFEPRQVFLAQSTRPALVTERSLEDVQTLLDREYEGAPPVLYKVGDKVEVFGLPGFPSKLIGTAVKFKSNGKVRVEIHYKYFEIHKNFLRPA